MAGQWADAESGLHDNVGRYYAPFVGQYLSVDPRWLDHLDTHPYRYARSDPFGRHDPLGDIAPLIIAIGGAALIGGVVNAGMTAWGGGSWRQIGASFAHGALSGAGMAVGAMLGGIPGLMVGAGAGGFLGSLAEQAINGEKLCFGCAAKEGLTEGLFTGAFGLAGKVLGPALGRLGRAISQSRIGQAIGRGVRKALDKALVRSRIRRLDSLKKKHGALDFDDFKPKGASYDDLPADVKRRMLSQYPKDMPLDQKEKYLKSLIESGAEHPTPVPVKPGERMYKIVPKGNTPSSVTPFWMSEQELAAAKANRVAMEQRYGLPLGSQAAEYEVFEVTAKKSTTVFESEVAPTAQRAYETTGGGKQVLVIDRGVWSDPVPIGSF